MVSLMVSMRPLRLRSGQALTLCPGAYSTINLRSSYWQSGSNQESPVAVDTPSLRINVRQAGPQDLPRLVQFNVSMAQETEGKALDPARLQQGVAAVLQRQDLGFYLLAELEGQVVGQLLITTEWSDWRNAFFWWVQSVYVLPQFRRRGVYRALEQRVRAQALEQGNVCGVRLYVDRDNLIAQQTYRALGMSPSHYDLYELDLWQ